MLSRSTVSNWRSVVQRYGRSVTCAFAVSVALVGSPPPAKAQIPVTDIASIINDIAGHIETLVQWYETFQRWQAQYEVLTGYWDALTSGRLTLATLANLRGTFPPELEGFLGQGVTLFGSLNGDYTRLRSAVSRLPAGYFPGASKLATQLDTTLTAIAKSQATADNVYRSSHENLESAQEFRTQSQSANTLKKSADLTARITAELLAVQSEANRLTAINMRIEADEKREVQLSTEALIEAVEKRPAAVTY